MKLKEAPIGSQVKFNDNLAIVIKHGEMGCLVKVFESKRESISLGNQMLSNQTEISSWIGVNPAKD